MKHLLQNRFVGMERSAAPDTLIGRRAWKLDQFHPALVPLATLVARGSRMVEGSFAALDRLFLASLPRGLVVILVLCVLYLTWR